MASCVAAVGAPPTVCPGITLTTLQPLACARVSQAVEDLPCKSGGDPDDTPMIARDSGILP